MHMHMHIHMHITCTFACTYACTCTCTCYKSLQAKVITKLRTFADACALPNAKRIMLPGRTGPVNAVEAGGELFIQNDEAEAEAEAIRAPKAESTAAALGSELPCAAASPTVMTPKSYAAVVKASVVTTAPAQPAAVPKFSAAVSMPSSDVKPSAAASQLAEDTTSLKVKDDISMSMHVHVCMCMCMCTSCACACAFACAFACAVHG